MCVVPVTSILSADFLAIIVKLCNALHILAQLVSQANYLRLTTYGADLLISALQEALALIRAGDASLFHIIALSLWVSGWATLIASVIGLPLGAWVALTPSRARAPLIVLLNACMGLPPVVVGLLIYLLLSRSGPLGALGWLFTPAAMIVAQAVLITPIIAALTRQVIEDGHTQYADWFSSLRLTVWQRARTLLHDCRFSLLTPLLAGFGRAIAEVVMIVGGNILGFTRVMTTTIALETSKGDLALALALGFILIAMVFALNGLAHGVKRFAERRYG
jgi:tungstate transport system permease protein